jgi:hypothetical protein
MEIVNHGVADGLIEKFGRFYEEMVAFKRGTWEERIQERLDLEIHVRFSPIYVTTEDHKIKV